MPKDYVITVLFVFGILISSTGSMFIVYQSVTYEFTQHINNCNFYMLLPEEMLAAESVNSPKEDDRVCGAQQQCSPRRHRSVHFGLKMPLPPPGASVCLPCHPAACVLAATQQQLQPVQRLATFQSVVQPS